jgi:hypothetical protein
VGVELSEHPVNHRDAVDLDHALGIVGRQVFQALAHTSSEYDCLHFFFLFIFLKSQAARSFQDSADG